MGRGSVFICYKWIDRRTIHLIVKSVTENLWTWTIRYGELVPFLFGQTQTKVAAQIDAQRAFEQWASAAAVELPDSTTFQWIEVADDEASDDD